MQHFNGLKPKQLLELAVPGTEVLVVGSGPNALAEYEEAIARFPYALVMHINNAGRLGLEAMPQLVATQHGAVGNFVGTGYMPLCNIPDDALLFCSPCNGDEHERVDAVYGGTGLWGTSALFGVMCCVYHGFESIYLAGVPLSGTGYGAPQKLAYWEEWKPVLQHRIKWIASGKLKNIFTEA